MHPPLLICFILSQLLLFYRVQCGCPKEFQCGKLGTMSFPFSNVTDQDCGLYFVDCTDVFYPSVKLWAEQDWVLGILSQNTNRLTVNYPVKNCNSFSQTFPNDSAISFTFQSNVTMLKCQNDSSSSDANKTQLVSLGYQMFETCKQAYFFDIYYNQSDDGRFFNYTGPTPPRCSTIKLPMQNRNVNSTEGMELYDLIADKWVLEWKLSESCQNCIDGGNRCEVDRFNNLNCPSEGRNLIKKDLTKISILFIVIVVAACSLVIFFVLWCRKKRTTGYSPHLSCLWKTKTRDYQNIENMLRNFGSLVPKRYKYRNVKRMTNSFKIKLGQGGYGSVFKGFLDDNSPVAVKLLISSNGNGEEFINEVASISRTSHVNIVNLLGFCFEGNKRALIYEFMPNGSLEKFIYGNNFLAAPQLGWETLFKISIGIARGLEYLHRGCATRIVHFDIKPHNILLDQDLCPKIADFGLSKLATRTESTISLTGV